MYPDGRIVNWEKDNLEWIWWNAWKKVQEIEKKIIAIMEFRSFTARGVAEEVFISKCLIFETLELS